MNRHFGPWATQVNAGRRPQLSLFWRQRMGKLAVVSGTLSKLSRRHVHLLATVALTLCLLPTVRVLPVAAQQPAPAQSAAAPLQPGEGAATAPPQSEGTSRRKGTPPRTCPQGNCSIAGKLVVEPTGEPIGGATIYLFYHVTFGSVFARTAADGTFAFTNIPQGPFSLHMVQQAGYQDAVYNPQGGHGQFPRFSLEAGENRAGIVVKAKRACRISGKVTDASGKLPANVERLRVAACFKKADSERDFYRHGSSPVNAADGSYAIDGLSDVPAYVMAFTLLPTGKADEYPPVYYPGTFSRDEAQAISFRNSPHVEGINIALPKDGGKTIEGTVRDEAGKPIPEALVVVHRPDMFVDQVASYTDGQGHYRLRGLGDGRFLMHVDAVQRGFVRTRTGISLDKAAVKVQRDFTLHPAVTIAGKFVDVNGKPWQIAQNHGMAYSNGYAVVVGDHGPPSGGATWGHFWNKYRPTVGVNHVLVAFALGEGDYECGDMLFPTDSTFIIQGMMPGHTVLAFAPQKEGQKAVQILYQGRNILAPPANAASGPATKKEHLVNILGLALFDLQASGIDTKPGQEIKDVTIVIGTSKGTPP